MVIQKDLTKYKMLGYFLISILLNSFANALTISLNLGSATWTASAVNLSYASGMALGMILFIYGVVVLVLNSILLREVDWRRILGNFIFITPFSWLVQVDTGLLKHFDFMQLSLVTRIILDIVGIFLISVAISIYQRVNFVQHPNDDLSYILRFKYFQGRPVIAQYVSFIPPIVVMIVSFMFTKQLYAVNVGTIVAILFQGTFIGWSDTHVFKNLVHHKNVF